MRQPPISLYDMTNIASERDVLARRMQALSSPARLRIIELLKDRALCVNALTAQLGITQGAVSQHLRVLRESGFVVPEKRGYFVHYTLDGAKVAEVRDALGAFLSGGGGAPGGKKGSEPCARRRSAARNRKT
jgi:DNA-binding transcriptional ArsR family regulator